MSDVNSEDRYLGVDDFDLDDVSWRTNVEESQQEASEEKRAVVSDSDHASDAGATHGGEWAVAFLDPTDRQPFHEIEFINTAPLLDQSRIQSLVWCGTMNDSLHLEYLSYRGNILCQCLLSFRPPALVDDQNQQIWDVVKEFALLNNAFVLEIAKQHSKLNSAMARLGSTAFQCSDRLENGMDLSMAVAPFEKAAMDLKERKDDLVDKNEMLEKQFATLAAKVQEHLMGDVPINNAYGSLKQSEEDLIVVRNKYLKKYAELNNDVTVHKGRLAQLEQQLTDMKYSAALLKEHHKLLQNQTIDSVKHHFQMALIETEANDYFYEKKHGSTVVYSKKIFREAAAEKTTRRSNELKRLMENGSQSANDKLEKHRAAVRRLRQEYTSEEKQMKGAELVMETTLRPLEKKLEYAESVYDRNLQILQEATKNTGVVLESLPLFLKAFSQIHFYNTDVQTTTIKILDQVHNIWKGLEDVLEGCRLWDKPLSKHKTFSGRLKPLAEILNDEGITENGELAPFHEKEEMEQLMKSILPNLKKHHGELLAEDGRRLRIGDKKNFKAICLEMSLTRKKLLDATKDIGGYLSTSFTAFKRGQKMIRKTTPQTLQIELETTVFTRGREMPAIEDAPQGSSADERKHDTTSSYKPQPKRKSAKDRSVK